MQGAVVNADMGNKIAYFNKSHRQTEDRQTDRQTDTLLTSDATAQEHTGLSQGTHKQTSTETTTIAYCLPTAHGHSQTGL